MEPEALPATPNAAYKAGIQLLVPLPARAVVAADRGMDQKEMAALVVPAVLVVGLMVQLAVVVIRHQLPHRKATMVATVREAGRLKSAVAAVAQELLAQPERLDGVARQEMAEMEELLRLAEHLFFMRVEVVAKLQAVGIQVMVALEAEALVA